MTLGRPRDVSARPPRPRHFYWIPAVALLLASLAGCGGDGDDSTTPSIRHPQDFLPQEVSGMTKDGEPRTATTAEELEAIIDGGSTIYVGHNYREFAEQQYLGTVSGQPATLTAWIFEMATEQDASALYDDEQIQTGNCQDINAIGDEERLCQALGSQMTQFRRGRYWVRLLITNTTQDANIVLELVATHIDTQITD